MENATNDPADQCLDFFDNMFEAIPESYRRMEEAQTEIKYTVVGKAKKEIKDAPSRSLLDIGKRAQAVIHEGQKENVKKSLARIAELTLEHKKKKEQKGQKEESDIEMDSDNEQNKFFGSDADADEEEKKEEQKKVFKNKNSQSKIKLSNKR